jgi:hemerythrin-like domain-containing protein
MLSEHRTIEVLVERITGSAVATPTDLATLADRLKAHIRFEERKLFPSLEAGVSEEALRRIHEELERRPTRDPM